MDMICVICICGVRRVKRLILMRMFVIDNFAEFESGRGPFRFLQPPPSETLKRRVKLLKKKTDLFIIVVRGTK